jgi:hypothetical protein
MLAANLLILGQVSPSPTAQKWSTMLAITASNEASCSGTTSSKPTSKVQPVSSVFSRQIAII